MNKAENAKPAPSGAGHLNPELDALGSVRLSTLRELSLFVKYESASAVASAAQITQSTLSKHMAELEEASGIKLFDRGYRLALNPTGRQFALAVAVFLSELSEERERLRYGGGLALSELKVESGAYSFKARGIALELLRGFVSENSDVVFRMVPLVKQGLVGTLESGDIDFGYWFDFGDDIDAIVEKRLEEGLELVYLCSNDLVIWAHEDHPIFELDHITVADVARESVMCMLNYNPNRIATMTREILASGPLRHYPVKKDVRAAGALDEFAMMEPGQSVYILMDSFMENQVLRVRPDMKYRIIEDCRRCLHSFMAWRRDTDNMAMRRFARFAQERLSC